MTLTRRPVMAALVAAALHARMRREGKKGEGIKPNKPSLLPFFFPSLDPRTIMPTRLLAIKSHQTVSPSHGTKFTDSS